MAIAEDVPMVGRQRELSQILRGISTGASFVIAGPAGAGKTRLMSEVAEELDTVVLRFVATEAARSVPLGLFAPAHEAPVSANSPLELLVATHRVLSDYETPPTVLVDDAHLADELSVSLLAQILTARSARLIVSVRTPADMAPELSNLWTSGLAQRIDLGALRLSEVEELACAALGDLVDVETIRMLASQSDGNPLYVRELLIGSVADGILVLKDGRWYASGSLPASVRLVDLIAQRVASLDAVASAALEYLAVADCALSRTLLEALAGNPSVDVLVRAGFVRLDRSADRLAIAHQLYADQVVASMGVERRAENLTRLLAVVGSGDVSDLDVARWHVSAGVSPDLDHGLELASAAMEVFDLDLAQSIVALLESSGRSFAASVIGLRAKLLAGVADDRDIAEVTELAVTDAESALLAISVARSQAFALADLDSAFATLGRAEERLSDPDSLAVVRSEQAALSIYGPGFAEIGKLADPILGRDPSDPQTLMNCLISLSIFTAFTGQSARCEDVYRQWLDALGVGSAIGGYAVHIPAASVAVARIHRGDRDGARAITAAATDLIRSRGNKWTSFTMIDGVNDLSQGFVTEAVDALQQAVDDWSRFDPYQLLSYTLAQLALARVFAGNLAVGRELLDTLEAFPPLFRATSEATRLRTEAWLRAKSEKPSEAIPFLEQAAEFASFLGHTVTEAVICHDFVRLGHSEMVRDRLMTLVAGFDDDLVAQTFPVHASAIIDGDAAALGAVAAAFAEQRHPLLAAESFAQQGAVLESQGRGNAALIAYRNAEAHLTESGAAPTPPLQRAHPLLTKRELEVARLAAGGLSNRAISEELIVSIRTVENHLASVFAKLGISRRSDLDESVLVTRRR